METLFRWIHLSDIHIGHGDAGHREDQMLVLNALRQDIAQQIGRGLPRPDAILVTGDIAFSGNGVVRPPDKESKEYERARTFLLDVASEAGVGPREIFVVPGNHDVNRGVDKDRDTGRLVKSLRARDGSDTIDDALRHDGDRARLTKRMAAYLDFAAGFAPACLDAARPPEERLFWVHRRAAEGGLRVRLVGLNSALLAADDDDQGKLALGLLQLRTALTEPPVEEGELVMVLSHHPFRSGWLADEQDIDPWIRNHTHVHLSGHVHEADSEQARSGAGGTFLRIVAGSVHGEKLPPGVHPSHGYSFGAVVREGGTLKIRIWPRKWSAKNASFRVDADTVPDGETHAEHDVRVKLPQRAAPAEPNAAAKSAVASAAAEGPIAAPTLPNLVTPSSPITPVAVKDILQVFISSCPEDEELRGELERHLRSLRRQIELTGAPSVDYGEDVRMAIEAQLRSAHIILILLSADYLASSDAEEDLRIAQERHKAHAARVIPILLRPTAISDLRSTDADKEWFEGLQRLPADGRPVTKWPDRDEAFTRVVAGLKQVVKQLKGTP